MKLLDRSAVVAAWALALALSLSPGESSAQQRKGSEPASGASSKASAGAKKTAGKADARGTPAAQRKARPAAVARAGQPARAVSGKRARAARKVAIVPAVPSVGRQTGLHEVSDPLALKSGVALVMDQDSHQVLLSKNSDAVLPIASITKLMTALVVIESGLSLDEVLTIDQDDAEHTSNSRSRLQSGTTMSRADMMRLALMSSENRAAHALSRHYPGGREAFVAAMNRKALQLGMGDTRFVEATGLSAENRSSAMDLARLVTAASAHEVIREFSTAKESLVPVGSAEKLVHFRSTNGLIGNPEWDISLQKTGYIAAAGRCLVMQAQMAGRRLVMVLLDSAGTYSRFGDAERIRQWLAKEGSSLAATAAAAATPAPR
ncbi:MAG: D-alanyl-D-alanine endopeptidase [Rubrivivax sp.]|nr:D-alanyl-D-alanine endopeptidase [Rubrivivax sp.]